MANLMENYTLDQIDEKLLWTILWKKGPYWANSWSLRMLEEKRDMYETTPVVLSEAKCKLAARNTNIQNNYLLQTS